MPIKKYFTDNGYLPSALQGYRARPVQLEAAEIIESSFKDFKNAVIEAPTGSGKTMAYLIPIFDSGRKVIIATKTKQLMNQILYKDAPAVQSFLGSGHYVRQLKGRKNYFCPERFYRLILPNAPFYADAVTWYESEMKRGITEAPWGRLDNDVCNMMTADRYQCRGSKCSYQPECPFYLEKELANKSDIIITNHHLFLSDMALKAGPSQNAGIFEFRDHAVFDEAHSIPDTYAQYAGAELSLFSLMLFFKENRTAMGLADFEEMQKRYFALAGRLKENRALYDVIIDDVHRLMEFCESLASNFKDNELKDEFKRYLFSLSEIESDKEGLRIVEKTDVRVSVRFIPIEAGSSFAEGLRQSVVSSIFISATLSSAGNFDYFLNEVGLDKASVNTVTLPAAFDLKKQARIYIPSSKELYKKDEIYLQLINKMKGSVLIICNSIERMLKVAELLKIAFKGKKILLQTDINIATLDTSQEMVLIGCASLREGIDLSGGGFRCVILDKLPFEYFEDFFLKSKAAKVEREIGNPFMNFYLPRAVLYFKQAVGRLIRHEDDFGIWVVLDDRILTKNYGKYFLDVLENVNVIRSASEALEFVEGGFHGETGI